MGNSRVNTPRAFPRESLAVFTKFALGTTTGTKKRLQQEIVTGKRPSASIAFKVEWAIIYLKRARRVSSDSSQVAAHQIVMNDEILKE